MKSCELFVRFILLGTTGSFLGLVQAEESRFSRVDMTWVKASELISEPSGTVFKSNELLVFTKRPEYRNKTDTRRTYVRIFPLDAGEHMPKAISEMVHSEKYFFKPCLVFLSLVLPVEINQSGRINILTLNKEWLLAVEGGSMQPRRYLLVFDTVSGDGHNLIRLSRNEVQEYFKSGIIIDVEAAPGQIFTRDEIDKQARKNKEDFEKDYLPHAAINDHTLNCYYPRRLAARPEGSAEEAALLALNEICMPD